MTPEQLPPLPERLRAASYALPSRGEWIERDGDTLPNNECTEAADEIVRLRAELDALRRDAERYRWLRGRPLDDDAIWIAVDSDRIIGRWGLGGSDPDGCDAAIDAAMKETP